MLREPSLQMPVVRFHIPVQVGTANGNGPRHQPVVFHQRQELRVELPLAANADLVRGGAAVVDLQLTGRFAQPVQRGLQPLTHRQQ